MTAIIAALLCEAQAVAAKYDIKLQKELGFIFGANQDIAIIISGVGSAKISCAVGFMQAKFAPNFWINIGVAGSINRRIGELFWIDKISKEKYNFYPDILLKTNLQFAPLYSCDVAKISNADTDMLYDMEGYDFANTASMFCGINKIAILKIVSDNCDNTLLTPQVVSTLMEQKVSEIVSFIELFRLQNITKSILDAKDESVILELCNAMRLTHSQSTLIINKAKSLIRRNLFNIDNFTTALYGHINNAKNKKLAFNEFLSNT